MIKIKKYNKFNLEKYINKISEDIMSIPDNSQSLKKWNQIQIDLMKDLNKMGKLDLSNPDSIYNFGQAFADYVYNHDMESPTPLEMLKYMRL